ATVCPPAYHNLLARSARSTYSLASPTHEREKHLHAMNAIPHQIRVVSFDGRRTVNAVPDDMPHHIPRTFQPLGFLPKTQGGGAEPRYASLFGQSCDLRRVLVAGGERFVNEDNLLVCHHRLHLF